MATATAPAPATKGTPPAPEFKPAPGDSITLHEFSNQRWRHNAAPGTARKDLVHPAYFSQIGYNGSGKSKLASFDIIECVGPDAKWWAELLVVSAANAIRPVVIELRFMDLSGVLVGMTHEGLPPNHEIRHNAQSNTYSAYRLSDGAKMTIDLPSYEDARRELLSHATLRQA